MLNEHTSLKNTTPAGDSNTLNEVVIGKINTYQRQFLIVAGSLLVYSALIAVASKTAGYSLVYTGGLAKGAGVQADYQVDSANSALTKDIFGLGAISENDGGKI